MAKVINPAYKFKPIKCSVCGCVYEHEEGDCIVAIAVEDILHNESRIISRRLNCPVCQNENELKVEGE